jgi:uncharacterized protein YbcV (DUF1398 family)
MNRKIIVQMAAMLSVSLAFHNCASVKQYQKSKLNDAEMELTARKVERGETNFQTYREGSAGANGGKAGGGCGCN